MNTYPVEGRSVLASSLRDAKQFAANCSGGECNPRPYGHEEYRFDTSKLSTAPKEEVHMKVLVAALALAGAFTVQSSTHVFANGQPNQSCQDVIVAGGQTPGGSGNVMHSGSPFNQATGGVAGSKYAGSSPQTTPVSMGGTYRGNGNPVSQYDVACFQVSGH
jgi:hypothetical protein